MFLTEAEVEVLTRPPGRDRLDMWQKLSLYGIVVFGLVLVACLLLLLYHVLEAFNINLL